MVPWVWPMGGVERRRDGRLMGIPSNLPLQPDVFNTRPNAPYAEVLDESTRNAKMANYVNVDTLPLCLATPKAKFLEELDGHVLRKAQSAVP